MMSKVLSLCGVVAVLLFGSDRLGAVQDPTKPLDYSGKSVLKDMPKLESIMLFKHKKIAIINGKPCSEKQVCAGGVLEKINTNEVVIRNKNGEQRVLLLGGSREKIKTQRQGSRPE